MVKWALDTKWHFMPKRLGPKRGTQPSTNNHSGAGFPAERENVVPGGVLLLPEVPARMVRIRGRPCRHTFDALRRAGDHVIDGARKEGDVGHVQPAPFRERKRTVGDRKATTRRNLRARDAPGSRPDP